MKCDECGKERKTNELVGKYVKVVHGNIFEKYMIFGTIEKVDEFDNIYLKIDWAFSKTFFHTPRLFSWNPFFAKREVLWVDDRDNPDDWNYKRGDIIDFKLEYTDWRVHHQIKETTPEELEKYLKVLEDLELIKGGWFGFP